LIALNNEAIAFLQSDAQGSDAQAVRCLCRALGSLGEAVGLHDRDPNPAACDTTPSLLRIHMERVSFDDDDSVPGTARRNSPDNLFDIFNSAFTLRLEEEEESGQEEEEQAPQEQESSSSSSASTLANIEELQCIAWVIHYNCAFAHHRRAFHCPRTATTNLRKALKLYSSVHGLLLQGESSTASLVSSDHRGLFHLALLMNLTHVHSYFWLREPTNKYRQQLRDVVRTVDPEHCGISGEEYSALTVAMTVDLHLEPFKFAPVA
jgi:hypothetical protein